MAVHGGRFRHGGWRWRNGHGVKVGLKNGKSQLLEQKEKKW